MIRIKTKILWLGLNSKIINHLGPNPKKGGSPPNDNRIEKKIRVWQDDKKVVELEIELILDVMIVKINIINMKEYVV